MAVDAANTRHFRQRGRVSATDAKRIIARLFSDWLVIDARVGDAADLDGADFVVHVPAATFLIEFKAVATTATIRHAAERLTKYARPATVPLLAVPFMGQVGRQICAELGVGWLDLSGNADLRAPNLRVLVDGRANRYVHLGRPATPFAPKSSRLARWLLTHPKTTFAQRELAAATDLDPSQISRLVGRLKDEGLIKIDKAGRVALGDRRLMLDAWQDDYDFRRHDALKCHMPGRTGDEVMLRLAGAMDASRLAYAFTGLAGAWALTHFAGFRLVTAYVDELPDEAWRHSNDVLEQDKGANVWFVRPNDDHVLRATRDVGGLRCVHPVQAWLDLKAHPERSREAGAELLDRILKGEFDG